MTNPMITTNAFPRILIKLNEVDAGGGADGVNIDGPGVGPYNEDDAGFEEKSPICLSLTKEVA
jgi:hypothetical protein